MQGAEAMRHMPAVVKSSGPLKSCCGHVGLEGKLRLFAPVAGGQKIGRPSQKHGSAVDHELRAKGFRGCSVTTDAGLLCTGRGANALEQILALFSDVVVRPELTSAAAVEQQCHVGQNRLAKGVYRQPAVLREEDRLQTQL